MGNHSHYRLHSPLYRKSFYTWDDNSFASLWSRNHLGRCLRCWVKENIFLFFRSSFFPFLVDIFSSTSLPLLICSLHEKNAQLGVATMFYFVLLAMIDLPFKFKFWVGVVQLVGFVSTYLFWVDMLIDPNSYLPIIFIAIFSCTYHIHDSWVLCSSLYCKYSQIDTILFHIWMEMYFVLIASSFHIIVWCYLSHFPSHGECGRILHFGIFAETIIPCSAFIN